MIVPPELPTVWALLLAGAGGLLGCVAGGQGGAGGVQLGAGLVALLQRRRQVEQQAGPVATSRVYAVIVRVLCTPNGDGLQFNMLCFCM